MHPRVQTFADRAREAHGIDIQVREFPEGTKTAADAAEAVGCEVGQIASSIVLDVDGDLVVAVTSGANRVDFEKVADHFGVPASAVGMADAEDIRDVVGWSIGGVPPVCHDTPVPTLFDPTLAEFDTVWAAAGTPSAVFSADPETLRACADAELVDVSE